MLVACFLACGTSFAQKLNQVSGKIVDEKMQVVPFAAVRLLSFPDSAILSSTASTIDGEYLFQSVKNGRYILSVSTVGFKNFKGSDFSIHNTGLKIPTVQLQSSSKQLNEVSVQVRRPFVDHQIDKTVLNVEGSIVSAGSTALDVLEKAPGISIDRQNDQIKLNSKTGVSVMIDGKNNFLSGADLTALLGNMSSDQIATIEIITNPSSKYDAAGNAGIINIKLKRNKSFGTNGSISINGGEGIMPNSPSDLYRAGISLNLNHRVNKWNIFGNSTFSRKATFNNTVVDRTTFSNGLSSAFNQNFDRKSRGIGYAAKLGADYYASDKTVFGIMLDANTVRTNLDIYSNTFINETQVNAKNANSVTQQAYSTAPTGNLTANFNVKHDFDKKDANITFDVDYSGYSNKKDEDFNASFYNPQGQLDKTTSLKNNTEANINIYAVKTDFTWPVSKTLKLESGLKSSYVVTDNDFKVEQLLSGNWQNDLGKSNHFVYKENINAAYLNLAKKWEHWQVQGGLRAEYTYSKGNSITDNKVVERNYLSLFPTVFVNQKINENNNINYSYSRRVDRPNYQQLNPFVFYMDPYALDQGNPYLKPQFTDNFEIGYGYKEFSLSLNFADTHDLITQISQQDDATRIVRVIRENLGRARNYSANIYAPFKLTKWWNMQNSASVFYSKFEDGNLEGMAYSAGKVAYNFYSAQSFILPNNFTIELNFWYNSPRVYGVEQTTIAQYALNAGIQKSMLNKKLKLRFNIDDLFLTNHWEGKLDYQNVNLQVVNRYTSRRATFNLSYSFGNQNVKSARTRNTATEDMKNRAGG